MDPVMDEDAVVACADLVGRTGATNFEIGYLHDDAPRSRPPGTPTPNTRAPGSPQTTTRALRRRPMRWRGGC